MDLGQKVTQVRIRSADSTIGRISAGFSITVSQM
jgi:DNA-binding cell septation regulator SpoVG